MKKLVLVLVAALVLGACGDDDDSTVDTTTTTTTVRTSTSAPEPTTTAPEAAGFDDAEATADAWVDAIAAGDDDTAFGMLSPRSVDAIGGRAGYDGMDIALSEGWGAWASAEDRELTVVTLPFPKDVVIVVFHGQVAQEGPPRESWNALPVIATDDGDRVEPFVDLGEVRVDPPEGSTIAEGDQLAASTPGGYDTFFIVDDGDAVLPRLQDVTESGAVWLHALDEALEPGLHALAVVVVHDGVMARRFEYTASG
jgi:hypothetical protein